MPFDISTITVAPLQGGVFDLMPPIEGVAEDSGGMIHVEVSAGNNPFTLRHAVLVDGPFQLPEGYRLASDVVYLYSDPSKPVRPFILHLPHWYHNEEGHQEEDEEEEGEGEGESRGEPEGERRGEAEGQKQAVEGRGKGGSPVFIMAPHTPRQEGEELSYKFELREGGIFPLSSIGSLLVDSHSTLFAIAFKEKITSKLKYCATHLEKDDVPDLKVVDIAVTFASPTWQKVHLCANGPYICI